MEEENFNSHWSHHGCKKFDYTKTYPLFMSLPNPKQDAVSSLIKSLFDIFGNQSVTKLKEKLFRSITVSKRWFKNG